MCIRGAHFLIGPVRQGGAVYVDSEGTLFTNDNVNYIGNTAVRLTCSSLMYWLPLC